MLPQNQVKFEQAATTIMSISEMINRFTDRNIDISDDILRQLIVNKFKSKDGIRAHNVIQYINQKNAKLIALASKADFNTRDFDGFMVHCRILALCLADTSDEDLKKETHKILTDLATANRKSQLSDEQKKLNELALAVALGRLGDFPDIAFEYIKPGNNLALRLAACRALESFASTRGDINTLKKCVSELFTYVDDDYQDVCDQSRASLLNIMFSNSDFDINLTLSQCLNTHLVIIREKIDKGQITEKDEAKYLGYGAKKTSTENKSLWLNSLDERFAMFKELLQKTSYIEDGVDTINIQANIPVAVIQKMAELAFSKDPDLIVNFFIDKLDDDYNIHGKLSKIACDIVTMYADKVTSKEVKDKAIARLTLLCKSDNDLSALDVIKAKFADALQLEEAEKLMQKAMSWIKGSTVINHDTAYRQACASHILGALGSVVNQDKYKNFTTDVRSECVEALVRQIKIGKHRDEYITSAVCNDLIEIMRHTSKLGMAAIMAQCLARTLIELENKTAKIDPESNFKPAQWRHRLYGMPQDSKQRADEQDRPCFVM